MKSGMFADAEFPQHVCSHGVFSCGLQLWKADCIQNQKPDIRCDLTSNAGRLLTLEDAIGYVGADELIEVTPGSVRLRKRELGSSARRAASKRSVAAA
jgi:hypothetical protein